MLYLLCIVSITFMIILLSLNKINIIIYHLVAGFMLSLASGGRYTWKIEGKKLYGVSTAVMYSTPPSFHSPLSSLTNTVHRLTLLCRKFPSLFKKLSALCHQIEVTCIIEISSVYHIEILDMIYDVLFIHTVIWNIPQEKYNSFLDSFSELHFCVKRLCNGSTRSVAK